MTNVDFLALVTKTHVFPWGSPDSSALTEDCCVLCWYVAECHAFLAAQSQHRWPWNCVWLHWERGWHTRLKSDGLIFGSTVKYHHGQWHIGNNKVVHFRLSWHLHWLLCSSGLEMIHPVSIYISSFSKHEALCFERSQRNNTLWFLSSVGQSLTLMMLHATRSSVHTHPFLLLLEEQRSFLSSYYIGPFLASCTELL